MEWTQESVIEFIELIKREPVLWNRRRRCGEYLNLVNAAWIRIKEAFSVPLPIVEFKKKKNSLFTQYRDIVRKMKDTNEHPTWFAYDLMDSFLSVYYKTKSPLKVEVEDHFIVEYSECGSPVQSDESANNMLVSQNTSIDGYQQNTSSKKMHYEMPNYNVKRIKEENTNEKKVDECELYGQLLAEKLKKLDEVDRMTLMNKIDNLTFEFVIATRAKYQ